MIPFYYKRFKYHLVLLFRVLAVGRKLPPIKSKKIEGVSAKIIEKLLDPTESDKIIRDARKIIDNCRPTDDPREDKERLRRRSFTEEILDAIETGGPMEVGGIEEDMPCDGRIKWYNESRGFGFVVVGGDTDIWFHVSETSVPPWHLKEGAEVTFVATKTQKGLVASKLELKNHAS